MYSALFRIIIILSNIKETSKGKNISANQITVTSRNGHTRGSKHDKTYCIFEQASTYESRPNHLKCWLFAGNRFQKTQKMWSPKSDCEATVYCRFLMGFWRNHVPKTIQNLSVWKAACGLPMPAVPQSLRPVGKRGTDSWDESPEVFDVFFHFLNVP